MKKLRLITFAFAVGFLSVHHATAQECKSLLHVGMDGLVSYLDRTAPNNENAECITFAIKALSGHRYEPAVPVLIKFLDFRRPPNALEKAHFFSTGLGDIYPAKDALEEIQEMRENARSAVLSGLLSAIGSASRSAAARENAVAVWMMLHRDRSSKGVVLLREEAVKASNPAVRENFIWALSKAQTLCNPSDKSRCRAAAVMPKP